MGNIVPLHKAVKERQEPQISAVALAEYLIGLSDTQQSILQNSRWVHPSVVAPYGSATRALRAYNTDPLRPRETLRLVKDTLTIQAAESTGKWAKAEALRCKEAIELFELAENSLGLRGLPLFPASRFNKFTVNGVAVSVQPDYLVKVDGPNGVRLGAGMLRLSKSPDPEDCKRPATKLDREEHRRELCRYLVALMQMLLEEHPELGSVDRDLIFAADLRLKERIGPAADHTARLRSIRAACDQIRQLWPTLEPKASIKKQAEGG
jgi:hypothetical protein